MTEHVEIDPALAHGMARPPTVLKIEIPMQDVGRDRSGPWTHVGDGRTQYVLRQGSEDRAVLNFEHEVTHRSVRIAAVVAALNAVDRFLAEEGAARG